MLLEYVRHSTLAWVGAAFILVSGSLGMTLASFDASLQNSTAISTLTLAAPTLTVTPALVRNGLATTYPQSSIKSWVMYCENTSNCYEVTTSAGAGYENVINRYVSGVWISKNIVPMPDPTSNGSTGVTALQCSSNTCMVGFGDAIVEMTGGAQVGTPYIDSSLTLAGLSCVDAATSCVALWDETVSGSVDAYPATWNGSSWTLASTPIFSDIASGVRQSLSCTGSTSSELCIASEGDQVSQSTNGTTWATSTLSSLGSQTINALSCGAITYCVLDTSGGEFDVFNGTSWDTPIATSATSGLFNIGCTAADFCETITGADHPITIDGLSVSKHLAVTVEISALNNSGSGTSSTLASNNEFQCVSNKTCTWAYSPQIYSNIGGGTPTSITNNPVAAITSPDCSGARTACYPTTVGTPTAGSNYGENIINAGSVALPTVGSPTATPTTINVGYRSNSGTGQIVISGQSPYSSIESANASPQPLRAVACAPHSETCMAVGDGGYGVPINAATPSTLYPSSGNYSLVSCAGNDLCAGFGTSGSTTDFGFAIHVINPEYYLGAWSNDTSDASGSALTSSGTPSSLSCVPDGSTNTLCVVGMSNNTSDPLFSYVGSGAYAQGGTDSYMPAQAQPSTGNINYTNVSCASDTFCMAAGQYVSGTDSGDNVYSTYNGSTWTAPALLTADETNTLMANTLSCASSTLCILGDSSANILIYNGSTFATTTTSAVYGATAPALLSHSVSCVVGGTSCMVVIDGGLVASYTASTGQWSQFGTFGTSPISSIQCSSSTVCTVAASNGSTSTIGLLAAGLPWNNILSYGHSGTVEDMSCLGTGVCMVTTGADYQEIDQNYLEIRANQNVGVSSALNAVTCDGIGCVAVGNSGTVDAYSWTSGTWQSTSTGGTTNLTSVAALSGGGGFAGDNSGNLWKILQSNSGTVTVDTTPVMSGLPTIAAVSCSSVGLCGAVGGSQSAIYYSGTWYPPVTLDSGYDNFVSLSCPSFATANFCALGDWMGNTYWMANGVNLAATQTQTDTSGQYAVSQYGVDANGSPMSNYFPVNNQATAKLNVVLPGIPSSEGSYTVTPEIDNWVGPASNTSYDTLYNLPR